MNITAPKIKNILFYTGVEASTYHLLLLTHQIMLYYYIGPTSYGVIGTLFSFIYLAVEYLNMGLDLSVMSMFGQYQQSYVYLKQLLVQLIINILVAMGVCILIICMFDLSIIHLTKSQSVICGFLIVSELTKKTLKSGMHLLFLQHYIALVEIICLVLYITTVWVLLWQGFDPSLFLIFCPMLCISFISLVTYGILLFHWYMSQDKNTQKAPAIKDLVRLRLQYYVYQILHSLYSPNFLIPLIAIHYDIELAALLKIVSMGLYTINSIIRYMCSITSATFFSYFKVTTCDEKPLVFKTLHAYMYKILSAAIVVCMLYHYILMRNHISYTHMVMFYLFVLIGLSEHVTIMYERFLMAEQQMIYLIACNALVLVPTLYIKQTINVDIKTLLVMLLITRCIYIIMIYFYTQSYIVQTTKSSYNRLAS